MSLFRSLFAVLVISVVFASCKPDILLPTDPEVQRAEDIEAINAKIDSLGLGTPDTTDSGARYFIIREGDPTANTVQQLDIVSLDYIGFLLDGRVFDTTIPAVADTAFTSTSNIVFQPEVYTYTETGWTLRYVPFVSQYLNGPNNSTALLDAISISFRTMVPGDRLIVFLTSEQARTGATSTPLPVYFEIFLRSNRAG